MAKHLLLNTTQVGTLVVYAGSEIDDVADADLKTKLEAAGGVLIVNTDAVIAAAAVLARDLKKRAGAITPGALDALMFGAVGRRAGDLALATAGKGASLVAMQDAGAFYTTDNVEAALAQLGLTLSGITRVQLTTGTLVAGTVTIAAGITVTALTRVVAIPAAVVTGSINFACLAHMFASNVVGGPGVGSVTVQALTDAGVLDADAAGAFNALLIN